MVHSVGMNGKTFFTELWQLQSIFSRFKDSENLHFNLYHDTISAFHNYYAICQDATVVDIFPFSNSLIIKHLFVLIIEPSNVENCTLSQHTTW